MLNVEQCPAWFFLVIHKDNHRVTIIEMVDLDMGKPNPRG